MEASQLERKSSAITLSDMEIFIFPELMYGLVLANLMSPRIWAWRDDPWFDGLEKMKFPRRINRLKQFIMDHYVFNLDLETWGLTTKTREMERFRGFIDPEALAQSNALFGYEGDRYYFDIDIRTHFGLDRYTDEAIPYWKTETVEAMDAFRHKPTYNNGAGECVSLAALYAAALFIVARVPLEDIYLMATPLHSQNFVDQGQGILTNNRRLVTKTMWFNGTALSAQARRALENERVTLVSHCTGWIHTLYRRATIAPESYDHFCRRLRSYLSVPLSEEVLGNFLRHRRDFQHCFQLRHPIYGLDRYIPLERVFAYEHGSPFRLTDRTRDKLLEEIDREEFHPAPLPGRAIYNEMEEFTRRRRIDLSDPDQREQMEAHFAIRCLDAAAAVESLRDFCRTEPRLPAVREKEFSEPASLLDLDPGMGREELIEHLGRIRKENELAEAAFQSYRDLTLVEPEPFLYAALTRNPVSREGTRELSTEEASEAVAALSGESIYDGPSRLAQPDEVWNFGRGDGLEKAVLLANILQSRSPDPSAVIVLEEDRVELRSGRREWTFPSAKKVGKGIWEVGAVTPRRSPSVRRNAGG